MPPVTTDSDKKTSIDHISKLTQADKESIQLKKSNVLYNFRGSRDTLYLLDIAKEFVMLNIEPKSIDRR